MAGRLSTYWKKRDFRVTSEPRGEVARPGEALAFVVQKHAATRLHYDFRLELDGTLKSWAVPKGPSFDPAVRRMAVHVEDHPLSYARFEGVIPKGEYGAGTVVVWDRGTWIPVGDPRKGYREGRLKFELRGEKLRGRWTLVRMHGRRDERQEPWLLIKERDEAARPAADYDVTEARPGSVLKGGRGKSRSPKSSKETKSKKRTLPLTLFPQLATLVDQPPTGGDWVYEVKFDGYRILASVEGDDVRLFTRNGNDWTSRLKPLRDAIRGLRFASAWIDGEIVMLDAHGRPDFQALQNAFDHAKARDIVYFAFDLPWFDGEDLTGRALTERRERLEAILEDAPADRIRFSPALEGAVESLLEGACREGLEGLIGKRADAPYASTRSGSWIKLKCTRRQEFVVCGWTDPKGSRVGFGSLVLGVHGPDGSLRYAGSVGTGFDDAGLERLHAKLEALATVRAPFERAPRGVRAHWVRPKLVAEVAFAEWTGDGRVRHPVFHGLRTDKAPESVTVEKPVGRGKSPSRVKGIVVTHGERVVDPSTGITKAELVEYYDRIAEHMLPHLEGRPIAMVRSPEGLAGEHFFQKHGDRIRIAGIRQLPRSYWPGHPAMLEIASRETLVSAAQMNVVEFHTWNSTTADIARPDRLILDLDPGAGVAWASVQEGARLVRRALDLLGLESFAKTSGGKGLHVVVPLAPAWDYDRVKDFSQRFVAYMARTLPALFVSKSGARNRVGRIFIDYLRNGKGATTIAAFSARARPGMGVSVPIAWRELAKVSSADQWTVRTVFERLKRQRTDPWRAYAGVRQTLEAASERLDQAAAAATNS